MPDSVMILFENLINRLSKNSQTGEYSLPGIITPDERAALLAAQEVMMSMKGEAANLPVATIKKSIKEHGSNPSFIEPKVAEIPNSIAAELLPRLEVASDVVADFNVTSEGIEKLLDISTISQVEFSDNIRLGLDFGTAYSKACMVRVEDHEEVILDLPLGIFAGEEALEMPVSSCLFIDPNGRLYFGPIAVERSLEARASGVDFSRIDSIKSFLIDEERVTIDDSPLPKTYNPTDVEVSKAALLTFYLGYLLHLVREAALERHGVDIRNVSQRVSLPCYEYNHRKKVIGELSKLFTLGEVLGRSFRDEWENGFRVEDVKYLYEWMRKNINKNSPHIERFLEEPLAVAGSRLSLTGSSVGNVCMIVDVGAGTTDFAMFEIFADATKTSAIATEVKGSEYGVPVAGDRLDTILLAYILKQAGVTRANDSYTDILTSLRLDIRGYKERLFTDNAVSFALLNGFAGEVVLSDFLQSEPVKGYSKSLYEAFVHVLSSIHPSWIKNKIIQKNMSSKLPVILTGGGAGLPMVRNLAKGVVNVKGYSVQLQSVSKRP